MTELTAKPASGNTRRFALNAAMNWLATAVSMVVPFFLTPFVIGHLGSLQYGIWIVSVSTVSYLALLDLGMRSAVIRFVARAQAQGLVHDASEIIGSALWLRSLAAAAVVLLSVVLSLAAPHLFRIPAEQMHAAAVTVLLCAIGVAVTLIAGVFSAVLSAINRFDLLSVLSMGQTVLRAAGVLLLLRAGHGLIAMAVWELVTISLAGFITALLVLRVYPASRARPRKPERSLRNTLFSYSFTTFLLMIAFQVVINTDSLVIGAFLSVSLVTYYTIGSSLVSYTTSVATSVSTMFMPMASRMDASGSLDELRRLLFRGTQGMLGLVLPIVTVLLIRGDTFITLWMGPGFGHVPETVLRILMISLFFAMGDTTAGAIMMAMDRHKPVARLAVVEAVLNLGLSIVLAKTIGLYGVAWGTSISIAATHLVFWPRYIRKVLHVPIAEFLWHGWGRILLCTVPFAATCVAVQRWWPAHNLFIFFLQIAVTLPAYALTVFAVYRKPILELVRRRRGVPAPGATGITAVTTGPAATPRLAEGG